MSKWSEEFITQHQNTGRVRKLTKELLNNDVEIAFKRIYTGKSYKRLNKSVKGGK